MKMRMVIVEYPDLETHLNRIKDYFTGNRVSMSNTTSSRIHDWIGFFLDWDIGNLIVNWEIGVCGQKRKKL